MGSGKRRFIGPISASLLDPAQGELRGLTTLAVLLLGGAVLISLSLSAAGQQLPSSLDQSLYRLSEADKFFFAKYANRIGYNLDNRLIARQNIGRLKSHQYPGDRY